MCPLHLNTHLLNPSVIGEMSVFLVTVCFLSCLVHPLRTLDRTWGPRSQRSQRRSRTYAWPGAAAMTWPLSYRSTVLTLNGRKLMFTSSASATTTWSGRRKTGEMVREGRASGLRGRSFQTGEEKTRKLSTMIDESFSCAGLKAYREPKWLTRITAMIMTIWTAGCLVSPITSPVKLMTWDKWRLSWRTRGWDTLLL